MKSKTLRDAYLTVRISKAKKAAYEQAAASDGRTLTGWVEWYLDNVVAKSAKKVRA